MTGNTHPPQNVWNLVNTPSTAVIFSEGPSSCSKNRRGLTGVVCSSSFRCVGLANGPTGPFRDILRRPFRTQTGNKEQEATNNSPRTKQTSKKTTNQTNKQTSKQANADNQQARKTAKHEERERPELAKGRSFRLQLWDTAGQARGFLRSFWSLRRWRSFQWKPPVNCDFWFGPGNPVCAKGHRASPKSAVGERNPCKNLKGQAFSAAKRPKHMVFTWRLHVFLDNHPKKSALFRGRGGGVKTMVITCVNGVSPLHQTLVVTHLCGVTAQAVTGLHVFFAVARLQGGKPYSETNMCVCVCVFFCFFLVAVFLVAVLTAPKESHHVLFFVWGGRRAPPKTDAHTHTHIHLQMCNYPLFSYGRSHSAGPWVDPS